MSYITISTGELLQCEWGAKRAVAAIIKAEKDGTNWMNLGDGVYYRTSHIVSVADEPPSAGMADMMDTLLRRKGGGDE